MIQWHLQIWLHCKLIDRMQSRNAFKTCINTCWSEILAEYQPLVLLLDAPQILFTPEPLVIGATPSRWNGSFESSTRKDHGMDDVSFGIQGPWSLGNSQTGSGHRSWDDHQRSCGDRLHLNGDCFFSQWLVMISTWLDYVTMDDIYIYTYRSRLTCD